MRKRAPTMHAMLQMSALGPHFAPRMTSGQRYCRVWMSSVKWCSTHVARMKRTAINDASKKPNQRYSVPLPKSAIFTVIFSGPSYTGMPSTDIALDESGVSAALMGSSVLELYGGGAAPARDCPPPAGACCDSSDGPACFPFPASGRVFSPNGDESSVTFDIRSAAASAESARLSAPLPRFSLASELRDLTFVELLTLAGPLAPPLSSILLIPKPQRSRWDVEPNEDDGEGSGCEPVMNTDSDRGVWFPPRPREGGTPMRRVGGGVCEADCAVSSAWITDSTSSMEIRTFSGLRSAQVVRFSS